MRENKYIFTMQTQNSLKKTGKRNKTNHWIEVLAVQTSAFKQCYFHLSRSLHLHHNLQNVTRTQSGFSFSIFMQFLYLPSHSCVILKAFYTHV